MDYPTQCSARSGLDVEHGNALRCSSPSRAASPANLAAEPAASIVRLPDDERRGAATWVDILNEFTKDFTQNGIPPRPHPGDLGTLFGPA